MQVKTGRKGSSDNWPKQVQIEAPFETIKKYFEPSKIKNISKIDVDSFNRSEIVFKSYEAFFLNDKAKDLLHCLIANYKFKSIFTPLNEDLRKLSNEQLKELWKAKEWFQKSGLNSYAKFFVPSYKPKEVKAHNVVKSISFKLNEGESLTIKNPMIVKELFLKFAAIIGEIENEETGEKKVINEPFLTGTNYEKLHNKIRKAFLKKVSQIIEYETELFNCSKTKDRLVLLGAFLASVGDLILESEYEEGNEYKEELRFQQNLRTEYEAYLFEEAREVLREK